MPEISFIIPFYCTEKYIEKCVRSVMAQTFNDFEIILVDDGSTDKSGEICAALAKEDKRIHIIRQECQGIANARNTGINNAKGQYIAFVDSDDSIHLEMYEILYNDLITTKSDIAICGFQRIFSEGAYIPVKQPFEKSKSVSSQEMFAQILMGQAKCGHAVWGKIYKKTLFANECFPSGRIYEDAAIVPKIIYKAKNISYREEAFYYYLQRPKSIMSRKFDSRNMEKIQACEDILAFIETNCPEYKQHGQCFMLSSALRVVYDLLEEGKSKFPKEYSALDDLLSKEKYKNNSYISSRHKLMLNIYHINKLLFKQIWRIRLNQKK